MLSLRPSPFALVLILAAAPSCSADPPPVTACTPGAQVSCGCPAGAAGVQVCDAAGSSLGPCMCSAADGGADVGAGADVATDASPAADGDAPDAAGLDAGPLDGQGPADVFQGVDVGGPCLSLLALCNGRCVDLRSDARNCHACGNVCAEGVCREGECVAADAGR